MFESRTETLREHIAYLESILSNDTGEAEEINQEEIQEFLDTCQTDIENLRADLPYDEIEEDDIPIEDFSDNLEDAEIEDEVVEVEQVIEELQQLMETARERFLEDDPDTETPVDLSLKSDNLSEEEFMKKLEDWIDRALKKKYDSKGIKKSDEEIVDLRKRTIENVTSGEWKIFPEYSVGLSHITKEMLYNYSLTKRLTHFENTLRMCLFLWENAI